METTADPRITILSDQIAEAQDWLKFVWIEFLKWFAFLCTLNVAALGAFHFIPANTQSILAIVFIVLNFGGCISTGFVMAYTNFAFLQESKAYAEIVRAYATANINGLDEVVKSTIPRRLAIWASISVLLALVLISFVWAWAFFQALSPSHRLSTLLIASECCS